MPRLTKPNNHVFIGLDAASKVMPFVALDRWHEDGSQMYAKLFKLDDTAGPRACRNGYRAVMRAVTELAALGFIEPGGRTRMRVAIEGVALYGNPGRSRAAVAQAYTVGAWQAALYEFPCVITFVPPSSWKKDVLGNGSLDKRRVAAAVRRRWPRHYRLVADSPDLIDAYCLARYATGLRRS